MTLRGLLAALRHWWRPETPPDYMELIVGRHGHMFVFRIKDRASRDLLLPSVMRCAANDDLPFDDDDAAAVMYDAVDAWGRADEIECRGK